jgi:hypothetical protein
LPEGKIIEIKESLIGEKNKNKEICLLYYDLSLKYS